MNKRDEFTDCDLTALGPNILRKLNELVGIAELVVIPGDQLDELAVEHDAGLAVKVAGASGREEVAAHDVLIRVSHDPLELVLRGTLDLGADLVVGRVLLKSAGQVDDRDIRDRDAEGHTGELTVERRKDLTNSLCGTGAGWDNIGAAAATTTPVLLGRPINWELSGRDGVDSSHEALLDTELLVDYHSERSKAVSRAGGVGDDLHRTWVIGLQVAATNEHRGVCGWGRDDDALASTGDVKLGVLLCGEAACTLEHNVHLGLAPRDLLGLHRLEDRDLVPVHRDGVITVGDRPLEASVDCVILEHVLHVLAVREGVVDRNNLDTVDVQRCPQGHSANAAEPVDPKTNRHFRISVGPVFVF